MKDKKIVIPLVPTLISILILFLSILPKTDTVLEGKNFSIFWPEKIIAGSSDSIQMNVKLDQSFLINDIFAKSNSSQVIPSLDSYMINLEARVDLIGISITPSGIMSKNILPDQKINFSWNINATTPGEYKGTIWLFINLISKQSNEKSIKEPIVAKPIKISVRNFLGLNVKLVRIFAGTLLFFSIFGIWMTKRKSNRK